MYLSDILIRNYKGIKELEIAFRDGPGVNILIGDNGVGKTSVLEAIATGLSAYLEGITGASPRNILIPDIRVHTELMGGASTAIKYITPVEIFCRAYIHGEHFEWVRVREAENTGFGARTHMLHSSTETTLKSFAKKLSNSIDNMLPVLSYLSTNRLSNAAIPAKRDPSDLIDDVEKKLHDRRNGYAGCMRNTIDKSMIKAWCLKMDMEHYFQGSPIAEYEAFKEIVGISMMHMSELDCQPQVYYSRQFRDIVYQENGHPLPISYLSAGYQSLLWIVMDIAFRIALLNPHYPDMRFTPGIVLIDELDMHLHPKWQWNVLRALRETFPNIQFIVATHSSVLISSCKDEHLIHIDENHQVSYPSDAYGHSIDDVVELVQGSTRIPKKAKQLFGQFEYALNSDNIEKARAILNDMIAEYGRDNTEVKVALAELSMVDPAFDEE